MEKTSLKILISSFIIGIVILSVALFTNQTSDIALNQNQAASVQLAQEEAPGGGVETNNPNAATVGGNEETNSDLTYEPISGIDFEEIKSSGGDDGTFIGFLRMIFNWSIAIIIALSTIYTVFGAVQYMTTDAISGKDEGKKRMQAAIGGLILALISWLILFSINQNILSTNFLLRLQGVEVQNNNSGGGVTTESTNPGGGVTTGNSGSTAPTVTQQEGEDALAGNNVTVKNGARVDGMTETAIDVAGEVGLVIGTSDAPLVLSSGTDSITIANQSNPGNVFEFDYEDNEETKDELDAYFSNIAGQESVDSVTKYLPYTTIIGGQEVDVVLTDTGWTVEVWEDELQQNNSGNDTGDNTNTGGNYTFTGFENTGGNQQTGSNNTRGNQNNFQPTNTGGGELITVGNILDWLQQNNGGSFNNTNTGNDNNYDAGGGFNFNNFTTLDPRYENDAVFQNQAWNNVFFPNSSGVDLRNMSTELSDLILEVRGFCCDRVVDIKDSDGSVLYQTYNSSLNISSINISNSTFLLEESIVEPVNHSRVRTWEDIDYNILRNLYPSQTLLDITEYLDCVENSNRTYCRRPSNFRNIEDRYRDASRKGIDSRDILNGVEYLGRSGDVNFKATRINVNSWLLGI
jgi:hypothetical protein